MCAPSSAGTWRPTPHCFPHSIHIVRAANTTVFHCIHWHPPYMRSLVRIRFPLQNQQSKTVTPIVLNSSEIWSTVADSTHSQMTTVVTVRKLWSKLETVLGVVDYESQLLTSEIVQKTWRNMEYGRKWWEIVDWMVGMVGRKLWRNGRKRGVWKII